MANADCRQCPRGRSQATIPRREGRVRIAGQTNKAHDPEGYSIPGQREACQRHAQSLGATVTAEFVEPGKSGTNLKRPALLEMLEELNRLKPNYVIFYDLSRTARDDFDAQWLWREVSARGALIQSTRERVYDTPAGRFMYTILSGVNALRSRDDAEKIKMGLERKFQAGGCHGPAHIGYVNTKKLLPGREVAVVELDPERADHVRTAFDLYATDNYSLSTLTDVLAETGLRTRPTPKKPSRPMSRASVHRMLGDDFYVGIVTHKGVKQRGIHEPLIEETTFERVQHILSSHRQRATAPTSTSTI